jgi:hypothetical protein
MTVLDPPDDVTPTSEGYRTYGSDVATDGAVVDEQMFCASRMCRATSGG